MTKAERPRRERGRLDGLKLAMMVAVQQRLQSMTVRTERLQILGVWVAFVAVNMIHVQLTLMHRDESALLTDRPSVGLVGIPRDIPQPTIALDRWRVFSFSANPTAWHVAAAPVLSLGALSALDTCAPLADGLKLNVRLSRHALL